MSRRRRRVTVASAITVGLVAAASVALAALPGLELIQKVSAFDSTATKGAGPSCPAGKRLLGAAGRATQGTTGNVALDEITPYANLSGVSVIGVEVPAGTPDSWSLTGYAICGTDTPSHRLERRKADSVSDSSPTKTVTVTCGASKKVVGAGGQINTPTSGTVVLEDIRPLLNLSGVEVVGVETGGGTTSNWYVTAYAICAYAPNVSGLQLVSAASVLDSSANKSAVATCPAGKKLTGAGGQVYIGTTGKAVLKAIVPKSDGVTANGVETYGGTNGAWEVRAHAICATP